MNTPFPSRFIMARGTDWRFGVNAQYLCVLYLTSLPIGTKPDSMRKTAVLRSVSLQSTNHICELRWFIDTIFPSTAYEDNLQWEGLYPFSHTYSSSLC